MIALALAGVITFLVYSRLRANVARPQLVEIVAAAKDVPAGVALAATDLNLIQWPATVPLPGSFKKIEDVAGRPLIYPLGKGEPVMARDLAIPGSGIGLSVKIPPGMRATSVRSNEVVGVAGFLFPGSHVDALGTFNVAGNADPVTQTLLQDVEVLTAGTQIEPDPTGKPQTVNVVTLLLSPEDSQKLLMASTQSTIQFVLRNGADQEKQTVKPTRLGELIAAAKPPVPPSAPAGRGHHPKAVQPEHRVPVPSVYVVEVIQGKERNEQKFSNGTPEEGGAKHQ
ncbi:MAG: Flp pilus assembly protein CpaB [Acidobacteriia bacterium]|nr:Flp pilus assembly protein CpaB [Terriglobia bacterium]